MNSDRKIGLIFTAASVIAIACLYGLERMGGNYLEEVKSEARAGTDVNVRTLALSKEEVNDVHLREVCLEGVTYYYTWAPKAVALAAKRTIDDKLVPCEGNNLKKYVVASFQ